MQAIVEKNSYFTVSYGQITKLVDAPAITEHLCRSVCADPSLAWQGNLFLKPRRFRARQLAETALLGRTASGAFLKPRAETGDPCPALVLKI